MKRFDHKKAAKKWTAAWEREGVYRARNTGKKRKEYVLAEFPYPSGEGLHMGHLRPYVAGDVYSRFCRMQGREVMYPMGWDAFGLPAENFAIKKGIHPSITTAKNIKNAKAQVKSWGIGFDWSREINTTDPEYYKWTQWIFLQFYKAGLAYESEGLINWCPKDKTGLANEEVVGGRCDRCGTIVEEKVVRQWYLKITAYAEKLLAGLKRLDWPEQIKLQQGNWIGKSEGALIQFPISNSGRDGKGEQIEVFTTRPDTIFGATYLVLAPEHAALSDLESEITNRKEVEEYVEKAKCKTETDRAAEGREKTGVELKGVSAINPATGKNIPVWVADYVLGGYGTGAIMAVPAHDDRDREFADKFGLPARSVVEDGILVNSGEFDGMKTEEGSKAITKKFGRKKIQYHLRDWVFSRQRYWGEPIPLIHCAKCGVVPVPEKDLPVKLPVVKRYEPTGTGESPLASVAKWVNTKCPKCKGPAKRETNTMPQWAGSSWYYLRYADPKNKKSFASQKLLKHWLPVDMYFGGMEHTTLHLLYSRFWHLFLYDQKLVPVPEPYAQRIPHGIILGPDGEKMSKSRGNVVSPDEIVGRFGADVLRMYEMFLGPHGATVGWNDGGIVGVARFLERVWRKFQEAPVKKSGDKALRAMHRAGKKIEEDIKGIRLNTAVSALMIFMNEAEAEPWDSAVREGFVKLLAPFAPFIAEDIWRTILGKKTSVHIASWPHFDAKIREESSFTLVVQINGKTRDMFEAPAGIKEKEALRLALKRDKIISVLGGKEPRRVIYVPGRLLNIVI